jgi:DNA-directed RNA polymerase subunit H (RpoH/RPB5)
MSLVQQVFKSRTHILEIMSSLGFQTSEYEGFSLLEVDNMVIQHTMDMLLERQQPIAKKAFIKYMLNTKITPQLLNEMMEDLYDINQLLTEKDLLILITNKNISDSLKEHIQFLFDHDGKHVIVHDIRALQFNGLKHRFVPRAEVLTPEATEQLKKEYHVADVVKQLPELDRFDAQAKLLCVRPGEVVKFWRLSQTAMENVYYRVCV